MRKLKESLGDFSDPVATCADYIEAKFHDKSIDTPGEQSSQMPSKALACSSFHPRQRQGKPKKQTIHGCKR